MTKLEERELEVLTYTGEPKLPDLINEETPLWVYAIGKAITYSMDEVFVILRNDIVLYTVVKAFSPGGIAKITEVRPYEFLREKFLPPKMELAEMKQFLASRAGIPEMKLRPMTKDKVLKLVYLYCIRTQIKHDKNNENYERTDSAENRPVDEVSGGELRESKGNGGEIE